MSAPRRCRDCDAEVAGRRWKCDDCKRMTGKPRTPSAVIAREREVLRLRASGTTFDQIAEQLGYADESGAWRAYRRALNRTGRDSLSRADRRDLQLHRIDLAINAIWGLVEKGDLAAIDRLERLEKLRARLEGTMTAARGGWDDEDHTEGDAGGAGAVVGPSRLVQLREKRESEAAARFPR